MGCAILTGGTMTSEGKIKGPPARDGTGSRALERLNPDETAAVLRRLLEVHPDLSSEAEKIARTLLQQVDYENVAAKIEDQIRVLDYEVLNARAGSHEWGYIEPSEAAGQALEVWYTGTDTRKSGEARQKKRPPLPLDFLNLVPKWIPMIERLGNKRK